MKQFITGVLFLIISASNAYAQAKKEQLSGKWKLTELIGKSISNTELQKRYSFTSDSLFYTSPARNLKGTYILNEQSGECKWHIDDVAEPMIFMVKILSDGKMHLWQPATNPIVGILEKIEK